MVQNEPVLNWSAEYETDMKFELERSYNNADFSVIKTVTSNPTAAYTYTEASVNKNQSAAYYRIKGSSRDGSIKYSETRMLKLTSASSTLSVSVYPNPTV